MPDWYGLCGSSGRPCKLVWSSKFGVDKIGTYPSELLPSRRTIWHVSVDGAYTFKPPLTSLGDSGTGLPLVDIFAGHGLFGSDIQYDTFMPQSQFILCFAKTANRFNVSHVITEEEMASVDQSGVGFIDVGEYVFDGIAAVFSKAQVEQELTQEEIAELNTTGESRQDRVFRKLFEQEFEGNRFKYVQTNKLGIEYRLDNGGPKSNAIFEQAGIGDLQSVTYLDGT